MSDVKDTYKYHLKVGKKVVHRGICCDLEDREMRHQQEFPGSRIVQVGRKTTRDAALKWERKGGFRPYMAPVGTGRGVVLSRMVNWEGVRTFLYKLAAVALLLVAGWGLSRLWVPFGTEGFFVALLRAIMGAILIAAAVFVLWGVGSWARGEFNHLFPKKEG